MILFLNIKKVSKNVKILKYFVNTKMNMVENGSLIHTQPKKIYSGSVRKDVTTTMEEEINEKDYLGWNTEKFKVGENVFYRPRLRSYLGLHKSKYKIDSKYER